jgi:hypothetical protein
MHQLVKIRSTQPLVISGWPKSVGSTSIPFGVQNHVSVYYRERKNESRLMTFSKANLNFSLLVNGKL